MKKLPQSLHAVAAIDPIKLWDFRSVVKKTGAVSIQSGTFLLGSWQVLQRGSKRPRVCEYKTQLPKSPTHYGCHFYRGIKYDLFCLASSGLKMISTLRQILHQIFNFLAELNAQRAVAVSRSNVSNSRVGPLSSLSRSAYRYRLVCESSNPCFITT